jgi:hypothetical protein
MINKTQFVVKGIIESEGNRIFIDGKEILPAYSQKIRNHSPDGFNWGYGGSGPAQTALAIRQCLFDEDIARSLYQAFKWQFVSGWPQGQSFETNVDISDFLIDNKETFQINKDVHL